MGLDERYLRGSWLLSGGVNKSLMGWDPNVGQPAAFIDPGSFPGGILPCPCDAIGGNFTIAFQSGTPEAAFFWAVDTSSSSPVFTQAATIDEAAQFSFVPSGDNSYSVAVYSASTLAGYLAVGGSKQVKGYSIYLLTLTCDKSQALSTNLVARQPTSQALFEALLPNEVMLFDGPSFSGNQLVVLGNSNLDSATFTGLFNQVASFMVGPQTGVYLPIMAAGAASVYRWYWGNLDLGGSMSVGDINTGVSQQPRVAGIQYLQIYGGEVVTQGSGGQLTTRTLSSSQPLSFSIDALAFQEVANRAEKGKVLPLDLAPLVKITAADSNSALTVQKGILEVSQSAIATYFYVVTETAAQAADGLLFSLREATTLDSVSWDATASAFVLDPDEDARTIFQWIAGGLPAYTYLEYPLNENQAVFYGALSYNASSEPAWIFTHDIPDVTLLTGSTWSAPATTPSAPVQSIQLGPNTQVAFYSEANFQGTSYLITASDATFYSWPKSFGTTIGSFRLLTIESAAAEGIEVGVELIYDQVYMAGFWDSYPAYRMVLLLHDANGNPRPFETLQLQATQPIQVSVTGQSYSLSLGSSVQVTTDMCGEVVITLPASCLSTPSLLVQTAGMALEAWVYLYPNQDLVEKLGRVTGEELLNGMPAVGGGSSKQGPLASVTGMTLEAANAIAAALNLVATTVTFDDGTESEVRNDPGVSGGATALMARGTRAAHMGRPSRRRVQHGRGRPRHWMLSFDTNGTPRFTTFATAAELQAAVYRRQPRATMPTPLSAGGLRPGADDLWDVIIDSAIVQWAVTEVEDLYDESEELLEEGEKLIKSAITYITYIADEVTSTAQLVVEDVEHLLDFVEILFKKLEVAIQTVIDFLAFLFDWPDILATQTQLSKAATGTIQLLDSVTSTIQKDIDTWFSRLQTQSDSAFEQFAQSLGFDTGSWPSHLPGGQQAAKRPRGRQALNNWLLSKLMELMPSVEWPSLDLPDKMDSQLESLAQAAWTNLTTSSQPGIPTLQDLFEQAVVEVVQQQQLLDNLVDVAGVGLQILEQVGDDMIAYVQGFADELVAVLDTSLENMNETLTQSMRIPIFGDLFENITNGQSLSPLNLTTLLVALPVTLVQKLAEFEAVQAGRPGAQAEVDDAAVTASVISFIRAFTGPIRDAAAGVATVSGLGNSNLSAPNIASVAAKIAPSNGPLWFLDLMDMVMSYVNQSMSRPDPYCFSSDTSTEEAFKILRWYGGFLSPLVTYALVTGDARNIQVTVNGKSVSIKQIGPWLLTGVGEISLAAAVSAEIQAREYGIKTASNLVNPLPTLFKFLRSQEIIEDTEGYSLLLLLVVDLLAGLAVGSLKAVEARPFRLR